MEQREALEPHLACIRLDEALMKRKAELRNTRGLSEKNGADA